MLMLPLAGIIMMTGFAATAMIGGTPDARGMLVAWIATDVFVVIYWIAIWRRSVVWTSRRQLLTLAAVGLGAFASILAVVVLRDFVGMPIEPRILFGNSMFPVVFVLMTVFVWRESTGERHARIVERGTDTVSCPICAYNMTGLREAKCPECGAVFTLDELLTSQAAESGEELGEA